MALINLRNALMTGKRLPYDAEVEYLEGTGTQWIDTGVAAFNWPYLEITCKVNGTYNAPYNRGIMGNSNGGSRWQGISPGGDSSVIFRGYDSATTISESVTADYITLIFDGPNRTAYAGQSSATLLSGKKAGARYGVWAYVGLVAPVAMSVASVKIGTSRDNLLFDGIPVRKGTVGYLYDRVSGKLFGNAGTGDFVLGPDVVPVEYIESHAAEYIDTGAIPDDSTGIEVVHTICPNNGTDNIIFGARQDSGNTRYWSDVDWGTFDSLGWGFNTYSGNSERFALSSSDVGRVVTNSLNYMNDRAGKIDGVTYDSSLQSKTLATMNRSVYLFGANNQGTVGIRGRFKVYSAKISKGQTLANNFLPIRVGTDATSWEGAMMDVLTRRIYRNEGTGAFTYGNDLKYPIPAS